jgi:hypothetical protein
MHGCIASTGVLIFHDMPSSQYVITIRWCLDRRTIRIPQTMHGRSAHSPCANLCCRHSVMFLSFLSMHAAYTCVHACCIHMCPCMLHTHVSMHAATTPIHGSMDSAYISVQACCICKHVYRCIPHTHLLLPSAYTSYVCMHTCTYVYKFIQCYWSRRHYVTAICA